MVCDLNLTVCVLKFVVGRAPGGRCLRALVLGCMFGTIGLTSGVPSIPGARLLQCTRLVLPYALIVWLMTPHHQVTWMKRLGSWQGSPCPRCADGGDDVATGRCMPQVLLEHPTATFHFHFKINLDEVV